MLLLHGFVINFALLIILIFGYSRIFRCFYGNNFSKSLINGLLFGFISLAVMSFPVIFAPGLIFDTRSIIISISGLFGGPFCALATAALAAAYRTYIGGPGAVMGVVVICESAILGTAYYYYRQKHDQALKPLYIYLFSLTVHVVMMLCMFLLPAEMVWKTIKNLVLPVIVVYPIVSSIIISLFKGIEDEIMLAENFQKNLNNYQNLVKKTNSVILRMTPNCTVNFINEFALNFFGYKEDEIVGKSVVGTLVPEKDSQNQNLGLMVKEISKHPEKYSLNENENMRKDGSRCWMAWSNTPVYDKNGELTEFITVGVEITKRKKLEFELKRKNKELEKLYKRFQIATDSAKIGVWEYDLTTKTLKWDKSMFALYGQEERDSEFQYEVWQKSLHPDDAARAEKEVEDAITGKKDFNTEFRIVSQDGQVRNIKAVAQTTMNSDGKAVSMIGINYDITELTKAQAKLRETRELAENVITVGPVAIVQVDINGQIIESNELAIELLELKKDQVSGMMVNAPEWHITDLDGGPFPEEKLAFRQVIDTEKPVYNVQYAINPNGRKRKALRINGAPLHDEHGQVNRVILTIQDITQQEEYLKELEHSKALLDATGQMARVGGWELNVKTKELMWTKETYLIHEVPLDSKPNVAEAINFFHPADRPILEKAIQNTMEEGKPYDLELRFISAKGINLITRTICKPILENGKVVYLQGTFQDITELRKTEANLKRIEWLLSSKNEEKPVIEQQYGDLTELNTSRVILDGVGKENLANIAMQSIDLLETSIAIYERNGDYAFGMFSSSWCQFMDKASRNLCGDVDNKAAIKCGKWLCHECCWNISKAAIDSAQATDAECMGGIHIYAMPIFAGEEVVGSINFGYGNPPTDDDKLKQLASDYQVDIAELRQKAQEYEMRPDYIIDHAKSNLHRAALLIGQIVTQSMLEEELIEAKSVAEASNKAKSEFLAMMSHEIRTPLNGILGFSGIIKDALHERLKDNEEDEVFEYLDTVSKCGNALTEILNDILEISSIESRAFSIASDEFNPRKIFDETLKVFHVPATENNVSINFAAESLPDSVVGDFRKLKQIIFNLVGNAVKFTHNGRVEVKVCCNSKGLLVEVSDTGIGIPEDKLDLILQPFTQVDQTNTRKYGGTGLGLTIVSRILDNINGTLEIQSELNKGSTFKFTYPVQFINPTNETVAVANDHDPVEDKNAKPIVLAVEDNEICILYLEKIFNTSGFKYKMASSFAQMQEICNQGFEPDVVLLDIALPDADGIKCLEWLKDYYAGKDIKYIAQTAHVLNRARDRYRLAGFDASIAKPYTKYEIVDLITK